MKGLVPLTSSRNHNYGTPWQIYAPLNEEHHFILDPCTTKDNPLKTPKFYTKEDDGLRQPWEESNFVNPPFNQTPLWLAKAYHEREERNAKSVFLLPSRTGTRWFHRYLYDKQKWQFMPGVTLRFLQGRPHFVDPVRQLQVKGGSTFDCLIAIIRPV